MTLMRRFMTEKKKLVPGLSRTQVLLRNLGAVGTLVSNDQSLSCEVQDRDHQDLDHQDLGRQDLDPNRQEEIRAENSDSASDAESEMSLDYSRCVSHPKRYPCREVEGECDTLPLSLNDQGESLEMRKPNRKLNRVDQPTNFVHWTNGHYVPKQTVVSKEDLSLVASRLKQEAMCDKEYRGMTPESTVEENVLRKNKDKIRDDQRVRRCFRFVPEILLKNTLTRLDTAYVCCQNL